MTGQTTDAEDAAQDALTIGSARALRICAALVLLTTVIYAVLFARLGLRGPVAEQLRSIAAERALFVAMSSADLMLHGCLFALLLLLGLALPAPGGRSRHRELVGLALASGFFLPALVIHATQATWIPRLVALGTPMALEQAALWYFLNPDSLPHAWEAGLCAPAAIGYWLIGAAHLDSPSPQRGLGISLLALGLFSALAPVGYVSGSPTMELIGMLGSVIPTVALAGFALRRGTLLARSKDAPAAAQKEPAT
ncbi:MAG: hypothetical protein U1A78_38635 [Polyangia bacterium]